MNDLTRDMQTLSVETRSFAAGPVPQNGSWFDATKTHPTSKLRFTSMPKLIPTLLEHTRTVLIYYDPRSPTFKQGPRTELCKTFDGSRPWLLGQASDQQVAEMLWRFWPFHRMDEKWDSEKKAETVKQRIEFEVETRAENYSSVGVNLIDAGYKPPGTLPSDVIGAIWTAKEYRPIKDAVRAAEDLKEKGNQLYAANLMSEAAWTYLSGLPELTPWLGLDWYLLYSEEETFGVGKVQHALNLNLAQAGLRWGEFAVAPAAAAACNAVLYTSNSTAAQAVKAWDRSAQINRRLLAMAGMPIPHFSDQIALCEKNKKQQAAKPDQTIPSSAPLGWWTVNEVALASGAMGDGNGGR